jgi:hypothetical protein
MKHYDFCRSYPARPRHAVDAARHLPRFVTATVGGNPPSARIGTFSLALWPLAPFPFNVANATESI